MFFPLRLLGSMCVHVLVCGKSGRGELGAGAGAGGESVRRGRRSSVSIGGGRLLGSGDAFTSGSRFISQSRPLGPQCWSGLRAIVEESPRL